MLVNMCSNMSCLKMLKLNSCGKIEKIIHQICVSINDCRKIDSFKWGPQLSYEGSNLGFHPSRLIVSKSVRLGRITGLMAESEEQRSYRNRSGKWSRHWHGRRNTAQMNHMSTHNISVNKRTVSTRRRQARREGSTDSRVTLHIHLRTVDWVSAMANKQHSFVCCWRWRPRAKRRLGNYDMSMFVRQPRQYRVGHGLDLSMYWIELGWIGSGFLGKFTDWIGWDYCDPVFKLVIVAAQLMLFLSN